MLQPNATLYVKNLDWKVKKPLMKRALYSLFTRHGKVLEVVTLRRDGLRGQAWAIFDNVQAATAALQAEQGFSLFGKDLVLEYARASSDRIAKRDGTYVPKAKRAKVTKEPESAEETSEQPVAAAETESSEQPAADLVPEEPPSKYLLAQSLPPDCNEMVLGMIFRQYAGYKEVRMPRPGLAFVEFEEESFATLAKNALNGFQLTKDDRLKLTYGKA
jgi:U2 small nuclear ribonucleoprotein B''